MKYLRTKDGFFVYAGKMPISLRNQAKGDYYRGVLDRKYHCYGVGILKKENIIKQSDDIEELIDKFVICSENGDKFIYDPFKLDGWIVEGTLYGAIWTDKGLIYVAKLNEKGEWELL